MKKTYIFLTIIFCFILFAGFNILTAATSPKSQKAVSDGLQRVIMAIETRGNTLGNVTFKIANAGNNAGDGQGARTHGGCIWPVNSGRAYIYGQGLGFAAKKRVGDKVNKLTTLSYNPNNGYSNHVPGRIEEGDSYSWDPVLREKYQVYISTEFDKTTGQSKDTTVTVQKWPIWKVADGQTDKFGVYNLITEERDLANYPKGPAMVADEQLHTVFKDTEIAKYLGDRDEMKRLGYPMRLQYEESVFYWNTEQYKDIVIIYYKVINMSTDTLNDCYLAPLSDNDIIDSVATDTAQVSNDIAKYYSTDTTLNLGYTWTNTDKGEAGKHFGYVGISLLMTPAVKQDGFLRSDKNIYQPDEQLGLKTFELFPIESDTIVLGDLYGYITSGKKAASILPSDIRLLYSTGPFNMLPGDTAKLFVMLNFATPSKGGEADGTDEDVVGLVNQVKLGRSFFYDEILTKIVEQETINKGNFSINSVYPNPAVSNVNIDFNKLISGYTNVEIINLMGQKIFSGNYYISDNGTNSLTLNIETIAQGAYVLKITNKGQISTKMFSILR
ncbi:MAG: T9SS type A sorting domain-containing protein [Bacteroidota bacterium]